MKMSFHAGRFVASAVFAGTILSTTLVLGQDDATRSAARTAGYEGVQAFERGDYAVAADKLGRAFDVMRVPTLGLWYARALVKTGKLVEAAERYREVARLDVNSGKVTEQKQAQAQAADELAKLEPTIPTLTIAVRGPTDSVDVTIDGSLVPNRLLGLARPVNPGTHEIKLVRNRREQSQSLSVAASESKTIELAADSGAVVSAADGGVAGQGDAQRPGTAGKKVDVTADSKRGATQRTIGWVAIGVGGVATVTGVVTGLLAGSKKSELDDSGACQSSACLPSQNDLRSSYNTMRNVSMIGFIAGGVGLAAGITLLLTAPSNEGKPQASAWMGVGAIGVKGSF